MGPTIKTIVGGRNYSLMLMHSGQLYGCGANLNGQLGDGTGTNQLVPIPLMEDITDVAAGRYHSFFIDADGTAMAAGDNEHCQLGDGTAID